MRININLASQPYQDARRFYLQWLPLLAGLLLSAVFLGGKAATNFRNSRTADRQLDAEHAKIDALDKEKKDAEAQLALPENSGTRDQALFLNTLFARKAFSWTQVLTDLEKIMPPRVQITGIKPQLTPAGELEFLVSLNTSQRDSAIELVRRMETSEHFERAQFRDESERQDTTDKQPKYKVEVVAHYDPQGHGGAR